LSETFLIVRVIERDMIKNHIGLPVNYPLPLTDLMKLELSLHISEKLSVRNFTQLCPVGVELLMRTDRQTDS
jgi:hypothetical protein